MNENNSIITDYEKDLEMVVGSFTVLNQKKPPSDKLVVGPVVRKARCCQLGDKKLDYAHDVIFHHNDQF